MNGGARDLKGLMGKANVHQARQTMKRLLALQHAAHVKLKATCDPDLQGLWQDHDSQLM